jgi:nitric oxide synthase oxygenase domain/subunit
MSNHLVASTGATGSDAKTLRDQISKAKEEFADAFFKRLNKYSIEQHIRPVTSAVANLPKEELAVMAETLVNLTSFKRRVTHDPETVGGPVDVAVISKGDGFIWIKRKHYFDPNLNHHFFANYYRN